MEVDEAASHIKELVDPDANIIWGSAFNNDLGGKIRVSVVATGIEAEVGAQPAPGEGVQLPGAPAAAVTAPAPEALREGRDARHRGDRERGRRRRAAARRGRHPDQPGRLAADRSARGRGRQRPGDRDHRRHPVRAHVEHRPRRVQGADRRGRRRLSARADRHPALPQPAKQPVIGRKCRRGTVPAGTAPFSFSALILHHICASPLASHGSP